MHNTVPSRSLRCDGWTDSSRWSIPRIDALQCLNNNPKLLRFDCGWARKKTFPLIPSFSSLRSEPANFYQLFYSSKGQSEAGGWIVTKNCKKKKKLDYLKIFRYLPHTHFFFTRRRPSLTVNWQICERHKPQSQAI